MNTKRILLIFLLTILNVNFIFAKDFHDRIIDKIPSDTGFRLTQIPEFYKNNPNKNFEKYGLIYPTALVVSEKKDGYYFALAIEKSPKYIKITKRKLFKLLVDFMPGLHVQDDVFLKPITERLKYVKKHTNFKTLHELYRYVALRIDKEHEQDFFIFEHSIFFIDLILDGFHVFISKTAWNFYNNIEKKSSYAYFKYTLNIISVYKMFNPYPIHGKKAPLLRALDMFAEDWEKSFFLYYEEDFPEKITK